MSLLGEYIVLVLDGHGRIEQRLERTSFTGHPAIGEKLRLGDALYRVDDVVHDPEPPGKTRRQTTVPLIYVRQVEGAPEGGLPESRDGRSPEKGRVHTLHLVGKAPKK